MKQLKIYILIIVLNLIGLNISNGQILSVQAKVDTNIILIGDQVKFSLEVTQPESFYLNFPQILDTIVDKIEVIEDLGIDTIISQNPNQILVKHNYLITSFDSGIYVFPSFDFTFQSFIDSTIDTISTVPMYFGVMTMALDTANPESIADIKLPYKAPLTFKEVLPYVAIGVLVLLAIAFLVYYFIKRKRNEPVFVRKPKPIEPPHIIAYRELDKLKSEKLWQKNLIKEYHSQVTEVIRVYIENRFQIRAMEQTSEEILDSFKNTQLIDSILFKAIQKIFLQADLVKFAKAIPLADENEKSLKDSYMFIDKTKQVVITKDENVKTTINSSTEEDIKEPINLNEVNKSKNTDN